MEPPTPGVRAGAKLVRSVAGFAIGGVAPIGRLTPIARWMEETPLSRASVWAAAGAPDAVFEIAPRRLLEIAGATAAALVRP